MNLKELENKINQDILNDNIDYDFGWTTKSKEDLSYSDTQRIVERLVRKYLKQTIYYGALYISEFGGQQNRGNILIECSNVRYKRSYYQIIIKIKRKVNKNKPSYYGTFYYVDKVEIQTITDDRTDKEIESIEDFVAYCRYKNNKYNDMTNNKAQEFMKKLQKYNLTLKEFEDLEYEFKSLPYDSKMKIREEKF